MADKKISQLTAATTPVAGTEVLPIVQGGSTVKVSVANLTAGRATNGLTWTSTSAGNDTAVLAGTGLTVTHSGGTTSFATFNQFPGWGGALSITSSATEFGVNSSLPFAIRSSAGLEMAKFSTVASAVNELTLTNAATGGAPVLSATGDDTNIDITLTPKGTGEVNISKVDIDAGAIDGTAIGANSASTGAFTTLTGTNIYTYTASNATAVNDTWYTLGAVSSNQIWRLMITDANTMGTWHRATDLYIDKSSVATFKDIYDINPGYATREWRISGGNLQWRVTGAGGNTANTVTAMRVA